MSSNILTRGLAALRAAGLPGDDAAWGLLQKKLERYLQEIELWNPKLGLVEAGGDELVKKHLLDSLAAFPLLIRLLETMPADKNIAMADIGSGAGLPGIPLLLAVECLLPMLVGRFTMSLVEKQQRRIGFLLNVKAIMGLSHLELCQDKVEDLAKVGRHFDVVCARAFCPLDTLMVAVLRSILSDNGRLFLYKGRLTKIDEELKASFLTRVDLVTLQDLPEFSTRLAQNSALVSAVTVPFLAEERHIVIIRPGAGVC